MKVIELEAEKEDMLKRVEGLERTAKLVTSEQERSKQLMIEVGNLEASNAKLQRQLEVTQKKVACISRDLSEAEEERTELKLQTENLRVQVSFCMSYVESVNGKVEIPFRNMENVADNFPCGWGM